MKRLSVFLLLLVGIATQAQEATWFTDLDEAKKEAKISKKPILMYFTGSDWCGPCKTLKTDFWENEAFLLQADDFVLLEIDIPFRDDIITPEHKEKNKKLQSKYNKGKTFPRLLALDASGRKKDEVSGYSMLRDTAPYYAFLDRARSVR